MMSVWSSLVGQDAAVAKLNEAAASARAIVASRGSGHATDEARSMSHAWLITGPPGSGRSVAALRELLIETPTGWVPAHALADITESIAELRYYREAVFRPQPGLETAELKEIATRHQVG